MTPIVRRALPITGAAVALALLVPSAMGSIERHQAIFEARSAVDSADAAADSYWASRFVLADAVSRASAFGDIAGSIASIAGAVDSEASASLLEDLAALDEFVATDPVQQPPTGEAGVAVPEEDAATAAARLVIAAAEESRRSWVTAEAEVRSIKAQLAMRHATAQFGWAAVAASAPAGAKALIASNASATVVSQTALTDAAAALAAPRAEPESALAAYVSAISALTKSHADEQARIAAEAAAAAAASAAQQRKKRAPYVFGPPDCILVHPVTKVPWQEEWFDGETFPVILCSYP